MKIGEIALKTNCTVETIRFYEKQGLLPEPERTSGNYREYTSDHLKRLQFIRNCRSLDLSHEEIQGLLHYWDTPSAPCQEVNVLVDRHIEHVRERMQELQRLMEQLISIRSSCTIPTETANCPILTELGDRSPSGVPHRGTVH